MQAYQDFLLNAYFWLFLGFLLRLPSLRSQKNSRSTLPPRACAPFDTLTCGSPLFHRLSTGAMARNALPELLERLARITDARYTFTRSALKISRSASPDRHNQRFRRTRDASTGRRYRCPGPHVLRFLAWMFLNGFLRRWNWTLGGAQVRFVLSPEIIVFIRMS